MRYRQGDRPELSDEEIVRLTTRERVSVDEIADYLGIGKIHARQRISEAMKMQMQPRKPMVDALIRWAADKPNVTWQMVSEHFQVHRATAYRMLADMRGRFQGGVTF